MHAPLHLPGVVRGILRPKLPMGQLRVTRVTLHSGRDVSVEAVGDVDPGWPARRFLPDLLSRASGW